MLQRLMARQSPFQFVSIIPIMKIAYAFVIAFLSSPEQHLGSTAHIRSIQKLGRLE